MGPSRRHLLWGAGALLVADEVRAANVEVRIVPPASDRKPPDPWKRGYTSAEIALIEKKYRLRFPPDLIDLYLTRRPTFGPDWLGDEAAVHKQLDWPFEGLLFDVERNSLWWDEWGLRPAGQDGRRAKLKEVIETAPRLIPINSHQYIPETPHERGNPVFSVYQSDIIYYGADLTEYLANDFGEGRFDVSRLPKRIPFWSEMVERNRPGGSRLK